MLEHRVFADGEGFEGFEQGVAEVVVEAFTDGIDLLLCFFREGIAQVLQHYRLAVGHAVIKQEINKVGKQVQHREGQQGDKVNKRQRNVIYNGFQMQDVCAKIYFSIKRTKESFIYRKRSARHPIHGSCPF